MILPNRIKEAPELSIDKLTIEPFYLIGRMENIAIASGHPGSPLFANGNRGGPEIFQLVKLRANVYGVYSLIQRTFISATGRPGVAGWDIVNRIYDETWAEWYVTVEDEAILIRCANNLANGILVSTVGQERAIRLQESAPNPWCYFLPTLARIAEQP